MYLQTFIKETIRGHVITAINDHEFNPLFIKVCLLLPDQFLSIICANIILENKYVILRMCST